MRRWVLTAVVLALTAGCTGDTRRGEAAPTTATTTGPASTTGPTGPTAPTATDPTATGTPEPSGPSTTTAPPATPAEVDGRAAHRTVRALAALGPREATSPAYHRAARLVAARFTALGYDVERDRVLVPAGVSWGVPVRSGRTVNLVARPPDHDPTRPHVVVGAHLDTVPQAPGAEDNASGVAVMLELARLAAQRPTRLPVVFVAFGAEEPRGPGDALHHFGSQAHVRRLTPALRDAVVGMVSLDRVGAPGRVPVCTGGLSPLRLRNALLRAADAAGVPARPCESRTSDHWSFEKAGITAARVGGNPFAAYHSPRDRPRVVDPRMLDRAGTLVWQWLQEPAR